MDGQLIFNNIFQVRDAALDGFGLAYVPEDLPRPHLAKGQLVWVLQEWPPPWSGYHGLTASATAFESTSKP